MQYIEWEVRYCLLGIWLLHNAVCIDRSVIELLGVGVHVFVCIYLYHFDIREQVINNTTGSTSGTGTA